MKVFAGGADLVDVVKVAFEMNIPGECLDEVVKILLNITASTIS